MAGKDYRDATKGGVLEGADFMNMAIVPSSYSGYGSVKAPPRPGTREPQLSEDQLIDMLRRKLGPDFGAAMSVPVHQWGGEWKGASREMKARIRAIQDIFHEMKGLRMTTVQDDDGGEISL